MIATKLMMLMMPQTSLTAVLSWRMVLFVGEGWLGPGKEVQVNVFIVNKQKRTIAASGDLR